MGWDDDEGHEPEEIAKLGHAVRETDKALLVELDDEEERWIPKSVIHDDSEVFDMEHQDGKLVVLRWWAEKEGFL